MNDYQEMFTDEEIRKSPYNIMGRFNREQFKINVEKYSLSNWKKEILNKHIWDLTYKEEDYDEDNDTSEEDEDDEHFDEDYMMIN